MVVAQLWLWRSSATRKAENGHDVDLPSRKMNVATASQDGGLISPKSRSKGASVMMRQSNPGSQKTKGTSTNLPKLNLGEVTATVIL